MKNNFVGDVDIPDRPRIAIRPVLLPVLMAIAVHIAGISWAAAQDITLKATDATIKEAIAQIEKQSDYVFLLADNIDRDLGKRITIDRTATVESLLSGMFAGTDLTYSILGSQGQIVVFRKDREAVPQATPSAEQDEQAEGVITLKGTVADMKGDPLTGVTVVVRSTGMGIVTNLDGSFSIDVEKGDVVTFSYLGYVTIDHVVDGSRELTVILKDDRVLMDEIVVVGYGTQKKVNMTGAVSMINVDQKMAGRTITSASTSLNGLVPGLMVQQSSGMAGKDGSVLRIRGLGTVNDSNPLIVVDGIPDIDIDRLDMNDIESISVLKDASSSAIYGSRAANGVILITTKGGRKGKVQVSYSGNLSVGQPTEFYEYLDDYPRAMMLQNRALSNANGALTFKDGTINEWMSRSMVDPVLYPNTDWWDVIFRKPVTQNHNVSAVGGNENGSYYLSVGILKQDGLMINNDYKRYSFRSNLDQKIIKSIRVGLNVAGQWSEQTYPEEDGLLTYGTTSTWGMIRTVAGILPRHPVTGEYGGAMAYGEDLLASNLLATYETSKNRNMRKDLNGVGFIEWSPIKEIKVKVDYGLIYRNDFIKSWAIPTTLQNFQTGLPGYETVSESAPISDRTNERYKTMLNMGGVFEKEIFDRQNLTLQFVYSEEYWHERYQLTSRGDRFHPNLTEINGAGVTTQGTGGSSSSEGLRSYIAKVNYDILDRYMFQALVRWDASSKFSKGHRWGTFPSVSAGWRFSEEGFFAPVRRIINNGKIRASWGQVGNNSGVGRYSQKDTYKSLPYTFGDNVLVEGYAPYKLIDPNFTWETTAMTNIGLEISTLDYRLSTELEYYNKLTTDMIRPGEISRLLSGLSAPDMNIGKMRNRGFEISVSWKDRIGDLHYSAVANYAYNKNKLLKWNQRLARGATFIGYPYEMVYTYKAAGIAQTWEQIANAPYHNDNIAPGDLLMQDINGDGYISSEDMVAMPNSMRYIPTSDFSLRLNFEWKGLDLSVLMQGNAGRKNFWLDNFNNVNVYTSRYAFQQHHLDNWTTENRAASLPRLSTGNDGGYNQAQSTYWLYPCDYVRLKNLQIGYTVPGAKLQRLGISSLRVYVSGENLATWTKWPGLDPEKLPSRGSEIPYPLIRNFSLGINLTL